MALYNNGILVSGANTIPQMTLAEYQALPVSERPTYWERTDLNYGNIPASDVTYDNGTVEDALDGLTDDIHGIKSSVSVLAENLYTYTTPGSYCVYLTSSASPLTSGDLCVLEVFAVKYGTSSGYVQRLNRVYPTTGAKIFQRAYYPAGGGWSAWREV